MNRQRDSSAGKLPAWPQLAVARGEPLVWGRRTYVMGIINLSPDSFSGDGLGADLAAVVEQGLRFQAEGADFLDVGAESTRPGSTPIRPERELELLLPALTALAAQVNIPISVDTYKSAVARPAIKAGAAILNDVWGLKYDPAIAAVAAETGAPLILMHNQQGREYRNLLPDIFASLQQSVAQALAAGVARDKIILDPGIGFGKTAEDNLEILRRLPEFRRLGFPLLLGTSRKSTIGRVLDLPVAERLIGTAATVALSIAGGADIVRVHDVREMAQVCRMSDAIVRGWSSAN